MARPNERCNAYMWLLPEFAPDKPGHAAFYRALPPEKLCARRMETRLLCGVATEACVHAASRVAANRVCRCNAADDAGAAGNQGLQQPAMEMIGVNGGISGAVPGAAALVRQPGGQLNKKNERMQ